MIRNVVFMGTPDFAIGTLDALIRSEKFKVQAVFTQPDKPKGRGGSLSAPPVKILALNAGIPVYQPVKIREKKWIDAIRELNPDVIVVTAFGQIIPQVILDIPPYGCINVHASLLPKYRGAAPIQWAVMEGEKESGVTTMRMNAGLDTGDIIMKQTVLLSDDETAGSLSDKLSAAGADLLMTTLDAIDNGSAQYEKQPDTSPTKYASMLKKEDGRISWRSDAVSIERRIRGLNPSPGAWTTYNGKLLKIWAAKAEGPDECLDGSSDKVRQAGMICSISKAALYVQTGDGIISLLELQAEGKKRMSAAAFLRGCHVKEGECFG